MEGERNLGRTPPHSQEAERSILGALLLDPERVPEVLEDLEPEDFYLERHRIVMTALADLADRGQPIDVVSLSERLMASKELEKIGGRAFLIGLTAEVTSVAHVAHHVKIVGETSILRKLIREATGILERAYDTRPDGEAVQAILDESEHGIFEVASRRQKTDATPIGRIVQEAFQRIDSATHRGALTGLPSGYYDLDEMMCGFNAGDLVIVAARPSMGKTAFVLNVIEHAALHPPPWLEGPPTILLFSLEMGQQAIVQRMLCSRARVDAHKLKTGIIPSEDYAELGRAAGELSDSKIFIDDTPGVSVMAMRSRARRLKQRHGLHMIVVDYLQLMTHPKAESRQLEISQISRSLKELARELDVPVVALSQLSRAVESRENKRPQLSDLRESGSIEQDADVVMMLFREEYYDPREDNRGMAEIIIGKQRNGPTGTAKLSFFGSIMRFENRALSMAEPIAP